MGKIAVTINYPKNVMELAATCGMLWLFARPMELLLGSKLIALSYLAAHTFTFFCFLPIQNNMIKNSLDINPYVFGFSAGVGLLFSFTGATKCFRFLNLLSWVPFFGVLVSAVHDTYENRPVLLTALLMSLYIKWKIRVY
jgi:hypothetical protein